ncbi:hypothetical protein JOB18_007974 [Solea senegalensis]|uniref:Transmembrane protein 132D n=1 Tax=Solea senegalensis TaxID=28829 RepID=A0AAV6R1H6_SOLSE|nr:transmembrane protein 132D [Solea senegalensis]KAG7498414.1 hypothetical protein JOB18_007974 [Solea senegalensis]
MARGYSLAEMVLTSPLRSLLPVVAVAALAAMKVAECQNAAVDLGTSFSPTPVYPTIDFQVLNVDHVFLRQDGLKPPGNSSLNVQTQTFYITGQGVSGILESSVNASYGPLTVDAPISPDLLLSGRKILPVILVRQVRSSSPAVKILFHMPSEKNATFGQQWKGSGEDKGRRSDGVKAKDGAHCVTAYAFWETREVRGACLVSPGGFCVAQLKPEPAWFSSASRSASSSREAGKTDEIKGLQGNLVEVYFQSRRDQSGQCTPQDSLQRVGVGRGRVSGGSGTPMRRIGSVNLIRTPPGNPTFLRLRLGGAVVIQTSSKPLKTKDVATFYVFLASTATLENFTLRATVKAGLSFTAVRPRDSTLWDVLLEPGRGATANTLSVICHRKVAITGKRGLLEVLQLDFVPKDVSEQVESQTISWRLEMPGNVKDVGLMRIYTTQRDYVGLAPLVMNTDMLNTAVLTGKMVSVPVRTLAVEADGSVTDVTNYTGCVSTEEDVVKVSEGCDYMYVNGKETRGKNRVTLNFTYGFLSAQLEMSVWMPRLPLLIDVADPELSQIKGWRVPVHTGNRRSTWDSDEDEDMRKGRGCMLQYQHSALRVLTPFVAQAAAAAPSDLLTESEEAVEYFLGPDWQVDVTNLVHRALKVADPDVAVVQDAAVLQGRSVGTTTVQVLSPLTSSVLAERTIRVVDDKVSVTELGVQLISGLSLSLQVSPGGSNRAIVATATAREQITQLKQEAVVSCWVQFSDGAVAPLELFDRSVYSLTVSTPLEGVATVRRTPLSTFVVAQGEGEGQGALVRVELRICEECQKSKRKSKLAVGTGLLRINFQSGSRATAESAGGSGVGTDGEKGFDGGGSQVVGDLKSTVTSQRSVTDVDKWSLRNILPDKQQFTIAEETTTDARSTRHVQPRVVWIGATRGNPFTVVPTTTLSSPRLNTPLSIATPVATTLGGIIRGEGQKRSYGNMLENPDSPPNNDIPEAEVITKYEKTKPKAPKVIESDLIQTFRSMSDLEISMYALVGVSCVAILAFILNCASYNLCFRKHKTPIQAGPGPIPSGDPKEHKHDWVWLGSNNHSAPPPCGVPTQVSTLKREAHCSLKSQHSKESMGRHGLENRLPTVSAPAVPERTATLGRSRTLSQQQFQAKAIDPMANRSATLLARPHRSEPLHSPTSKRNQVQFTTFTTLDIKHLAALKKNGVDLNWANQQTQQHQAPAEPQIPLPDIPWPVVTPLGEPQ